MVSGRHVASAQARDESLDFRGLVQNLQRAADFVADRPGFGTEAGAPVDDADVRHVADQFADGLGRGRDGTK